METNKPEIEKAANPSSVPLVETRDESWAAQGSSCGCYAVNVAQPVNLCPRHAAVDDLYDAVIQALAYMDSPAHDNYQSSLLKEKAISKARAVIAKVEKGVDLK